jgi:hypothetical protein
LTLFAPPHRPQGERNLIFTIYVPLSQRCIISNLKSIGYQKEVKNVQILTDTIYHVWPRPEGKTSTLGRMKFSTLVDTFLLYIARHLVFFIYM